MVDYSTLAQFVQDIERSDPTTGLLLKQLYGNRFHLVYITVEKFLTDHRVYQAAYDRASVYLGNVEKTLKKYYKDKTGETLKFKIVQEGQSNEPLGYYAGGTSGAESSYFRLIREYEIDVKEEDFKVSP